MLRLDEFREFLEKEKLDNDKIDHAITMVVEFFTFLNTDDVKTKLANYYL